MAIAARADRSGSGKGVNSEVLNSSKGLDPFSQYPALGDEGGMRYALGGVLHAAGAAAAGGVDGAVPVDPADSMCGLLWCAAEIVCKLAMGGGGATLLLPGEELGLCTSADRALNCGVNLLNAMALGLLTCGCCKSEASDSSC